MAAALADRPWLTHAVAHRVETLAASTMAMDHVGIADRLATLVARNRVLHEVECVNLNPASNVMNPAAEAMLAAGLGARPSLGYPGDKYEMGLEAIEEIEVIAAELAAEVFGARYVEIRVGSGAFANLYAFMATCPPGASIIAPPASIGGHVTHHRAGAAGLYGLTTIAAPVDADRYSVDLPALAELVLQVRPSLVTVGGSLNMFPHPVADIREIADSVNAKVLFDAAHMCGVIAGKVWPNPLAEGAHLMTMSTYKSLGGPPGGLVLTNDAEIAQRLEAIAYPGLTANFDAGRTAALAQTLLDWKVVGANYARAMVVTAVGLADSLRTCGIPVFMPGGRLTQSHQFAIDARDYHGGQSAARRLRAVNLLTTGIGLPIGEIPGDVNGLRLGTPEVARLGMTEDEMPALAEFIARGLRGADDPRRVAEEVSAWRRPFHRIHFTANPSTLTAPPRTNDRTA